MGAKFVAVAKYNKKNNAQKKSHGLDIVFGGKGDGWGWFKDPNVSAEVNHEGLSRTTSSSSI